MSLRSSTRYDSWLHRKRYLICTCLLVIRLYSILSKAIGSNKFQLSKVKITIATEFKSPKFTQFVVCTCSSRHSVNINESMTLIDRKCKSSSICFCKNHFIKDIKVSLVPRPAPRLPYSTNKVIMSLLRRVQINCVLRGKGIVNRCEEVKLVFMRLFSLVETRRTKRTQRMQ